MSSWNFIHCALVIFELDELCRKLIMCLGYPGGGMNVVGIGVLEVLQGVFVVFQALVNVGFAEKADLFVGDVSEGVMELSDATQCQPHRTLSTTQNADGLTVHSLSPSSYERFHSLSEPSRSNSLHDTSRWGTAHPSRRLH